MGTFKNIIYISTYGVKNTITTYSAMLHDILISKAVKYPGEINTKF